MRKYLSDCRGSFTLEATIVLPVFLALMLLLINLINVCMVYLAVDHAVSETLKQIATRAYPLKYLKFTPGSNGSPKFTEILRNLSSFNSGTEKQESNFTETDIITVLGGKIAGEVTDQAINSIMKPLVRQNIKDLYPLENLDGDSLIITKFKMYNPNKSPGSVDIINGIPLNDKDIAISVEYKVRLPVPFFSLKEIRLSSSAVESAWAD